MEVSFDSLDRYLSFPSVPNYYHSLSRHCDWNKYSWQAIKRTSLYNNRPKMLRYVTANISSVRQTLLIKCFLWTQHFHAFNLSMTKILQNFRVFARVLKLSFVLPDVIFAIIFFTDFRECDIKILSQETHSSFAVEKYLLALLKMLFENKTVSMQSVL